MPHIWTDNKVVVTKDELIPDFFPTWDALKYKLHRDARKPCGIKRAQRGGGLNCELLIDFDSLPKSIRDALGDPRRVDCILERFYWEDAKAVEYFANKKAGKQGYIPAERQKEYVLNASVLSAAIRLKSTHLAECAIKGITSKNTDKFISDSVNTFNYFRSIKKLTQHTLPTNYISLKRKIIRYQKDGFESLLNRYDNNNAAKKTERITALLSSLFIQSEKPTQIEVYRQYDAFLRGEIEVINENTGEVYNPKYYGKLSERTVTSFLASWKERVSTYLHRSANRQQYMGKFEPAQSLKQPDYAGAILSVDDRQPPFEYENGKRVWFYNAIDLGSECITAWVWGKSKEGIIGEFYRELVRNYAEWGVPLPYEIECESSLNSTFKDTILREGNMFQCVRIIPNNARSKRIERYFGNLRYQYEKKRSGWIGRPFARNEAYQSNSDKKTLIPYDIIVRDCIQDIIDWNNSPHTQHPKKTRWEVFLEMQSPGLTPINWRGILPYLGEKTETSVHTGQIRLNNSLFLLGDEGQIYTGKKLLDLMEIVEDKDVDVYWLRGHEGQVLKALVYYNDRCICEALPKPIAHRSKLEAMNDPKAEENFALMERYKNTIRGYAQRHRKEFEKVLVIDNRKTTLNNGFKVTWMEGLKRNNREESHEAVALPPIEDDFYLGDYQTGHKTQALSDRF
jgi:hypothetical protein